MAKEANVSYGPCVTVLVKIWRCPHSNTWESGQKTALLAKTVGKRLARAEILLFRLEAGTLSNLVFSDKKKFDVQHHVNPQNDRVWSCDREVGPRRVTQVQGTASVMVWGAITESVRSPLVFVEQGVKLNQESYQNDILVGSLLPWAKEHFKKHPRTFQLDLAPSHGAKKTQEWLYQPMFPTLFPKRNGPLYHPIWILLILVSGGTLRARSQQHIIKAWRHRRWNYGRNGWKCPRTWFVTLAGHFWGIFSL